MSAPDLDELRDRFLSALRKELGKFPIDHRATVREFATCVADAAEVIRAEYGDFASDFCIALSKEIISNIQHSR